MPSEIGSSARIVKRKAKVLKRPIERLVKYGFYENAASLMQFASALAERHNEVEIIALRRTDQARF